MDTVGTLLHPSDGIPPLPPMSLASEHWVCVDPGLTGSCGLWQALDHSLRGGEAMMDLVSIILLTL